VSGAGLRVGAASRSGLPMGEAGPGRVLAVPDPISHVNVWPVADELVVTWRGGSEQVSVFVSDDPNDAGTDVRAPDERGRLTVERSGGRRYIHLFEPENGFIVAAQRQVEMDGPENFRDLGGYALIDGGHSRWGQVFRSDRLDDLSDPDHGRLRDLGITTVFDLRSRAEIDLAPDRLPADVQYVSLPMSSDVAQHRSMVQRILDGDLPKLDQADMAGGYVRMLEGFGAHIATVITAVAAGERVVFHCTAGKDRTGVMAMVLLGIAGVADPYLLDDYEASSRYRSRSEPSQFAQMITAAGYDPADYAAMWGSDRPVMKLTLDEMRERWGDHESYVRSIGVDMSTTAAARAMLRSGP